MPRYADLGAQLLQDAAAFFRTLASENPALQASMTNNAASFEQAALRLMADPLGSTGDKTHVAVAVQFLNVAAKLFRTLGDQNEPIREQMHTNADTFIEIASQLLQTPTEEAN
jgi:hypothetical protein